MYQSTAQLDLTKPEGRAELEAILLQRVKDAETRKWQLALQWFDNYAYLLGNHTSRFFYSTTGGFTMYRFAAQEEDEFTRCIAQTADNYLIPAVESAVALLTNKDIQPRLAPGSDRPADEDASGIGQSLLRAVSEAPIQMRELAPEAALIAAICDEVVAETEYGATETLIEVPKTKRRKRKNPLREYDENEPEFVTEEEQVGVDAEPLEDIQVRLWTSFHIDRDPSATSNKNMRWISRSTYEHVDWVVENYCKDEDGFVYGSKDVEALRSQIEERGDCFLSPLYWWDRVRDIIPSPPTDSLGMTASVEIARGYNQDQTVFVVWDEAPSRHAPRGRTYVTAGGKLLYYGDARAWVNPRGAAGEAKIRRWHPYSFFTWFKTPGRPSGAALLSQVLPLQKRINGIDAAIAANRGYASFGQWFIPRGCNVGLGTITGLWGQQFLYDELATNAKPERVQQPTLPEYYWTERMQLAKSIDRIAASGIVPSDQISASAARAGSLLDIAQRQKMENKAPTLTRWEAFLESIYTNVLIEFQERLQAGDEEVRSRILSIARDISPMALQNFAIASLLDNHSIKLDLVNQAMVSPEAEKELAIQYFQAVQQGAGPTPAERNMVMRVLGLEKYMRNPLDSSINRMRRTLARIKEGTLTAAVIEEVIMLPGEDATAQLPLIVDVILSDEFQLSGEGAFSPEIKQTLMFYYQAYSGLAQQQEQQRIQNQMMMMQMQAAAGGGK